MVLMLMLMLLTVLEVSGCCVSLNQRSSLNSVVVVVVVVVVVDSSSQRRWCLIQTHYTAMVSLHSVSLHTNITDDHRLIRLCGFVP